LEIFMPHYRPGEASNVIDIRGARRQLTGLTSEEAIEFESLDALMPLDERGQIAWAFEGHPTTPREKRWLELFNKIQSSTQ
jgi:hypothetical protein